MTLDWKAGLARIDDMSLRERALLFGAIAAVGLLLAQLTLIDPVLRKQKALIDRVNRNQAQINTVRAQIEQTVRAGDKARHPDRAAIEALEQQIAEADRALLDKEGGLIAPERLPALLKALLASSKAVELESLRVLPGVAVRAGPLETGLYRHGVELSLKGRYFDLVRYLEELEKRGSVLLWGTVALEVDEYPEVKLRVVIQSLSRNASLLSI